MLLVLCLAAVALAQQLRCIEGYVSVYTEARDWRSNTYLGPLSGRKTPFEILQRGVGDYKRVRVASCAGKTLEGWALLPEATISFCNCPPPSPFQWDHVDESGLSQVTFDESGSTCVAGARPGVAALRFVVQRNVRGLSDAGIYNCRSTATGGISEHAEGRAWDAGAPRKSALGAALANGLVKHASPLGVQSVIW